MTVDVGVLASVLAVYLVIVVSPGPNFALVTRLALRESRRTTNCAILGLAVAATIYAIAAMSGMAVVITQVGWMAGAIQLAGGAYLVFLGLKSWQSKTGSSDEPEREHARRGDGLTGLRLGLMVNLSNPKAIAFFVGLYAVAVPPGATLTTRAVVLTAGFALEIFWYSLVAQALSRQRLRAAYQRHTRRIDRGIGALLVVFGIRLASDR